LEPTITVLARTKSNLPDDRRSESPPVVVRLFVSSKRRPHFKRCRSLRMNKNMVMGPETKIDCTGEGQQQFT
jgi:hypothetical protein